MRSESEKSFDECQIRRARLQSLGLAYLSPQNKSLAQSFRYMRNKPTIIAFKTPSLENYEASLALLPGNTQNPERAAEEGRSPTIVKVGARSDDVSLELVAAKPPVTSMNYPVGKPLEVRLTLYKKTTWKGKYRSTDNSMNEKKGKTHQKSDEISC